MLINVAFSVCLRSTFQSDVYYQSPFPAVPCYVQKQLKLKGVLTTSVSSRRPCLMQQFCQSGITKIEVLFVWPGDAIYARVFCRYLRHLLSDLKDNFTTEFSEFFYVGRMNKIRNPFLRFLHFEKPNKSRHISDAICHRCWFTSRPKRNPFVVHAFHRNYRFALKFLTAGCAQDTRKTAVFWLWLRLR